MRNLSWVYELLTARAYRAIEERFLASLATTDLASYGSANSFPPKFVSTRTDRFPGVL
jgi:hypothetical protein